MKKIFTLTAIACLAISIPSCKKDKDPDPPAKKCRLTAITITPSTGTPSTTSFSYNNDKTLSQIISSGSPVVTNTFTYSGNTINRITKEGNAITGKTVMTTNSAGNLLHSEDRDINTDTITSKSDYEYNSNGELLKVTTKYGSSAPQIENSVFLNGNLSTIGGSGSLTSLEYNTDKKFQIGDYLHLIQLLNTGSAFYIINKNLVKSITNGSNITNFDYAFDANSNITQMKIVNGASITTIDVQQVCE